MCYCTVFAFFILYFRVVSKYRSPVVIFGGRFNEGFLELRFFWVGREGLYLERLIFGILRHSKNGLRSLYRLT